MTPIDSIITHCPERIEYKKYFIKKEFDKDILKKLTGRYKLAFHNYFAEVYPYLRFEIGEDKVFWNYNEATGIYDEVTLVTVKELVIKLLIDEGLNGLANETFAKTVISRYRACFQERGNTYDDFDTDNEWFHCNNGWVNVLTKNFENHTPNRLSRRISAVKYNHEAQCPNYNKFLDEQIQIPKDQVRVIDQFSGLLLTKDITKQKMLVIVGRPGCGKSTLLDAWNDVLGDMATSKKLSEISNDTFSRFSGANLVDKTLCWFDEAEVHRSELGTALNTLITGQNIRVERKGINGITNPRNKIKCVLTANILPKSAEIGIYRRILLIYFDYSFTDSMTDNKKIREILQNESSGILNRMLTGLADLNKMNDFTQMEGHNELIEEYKTESNTIAEFLDEYFVYNSYAEPIANKVLLNAYKDFSDDKYIKSLTPRRFGRMLCNNGLLKFIDIQTIKSTKGIRCWSGLQLREEYTLTQNHFEGSIKLKNDFDNF